MTAAKALMYLRSIPHWNLIHCIAPEDVLKNTAIVQFAVYCAYRGRLETAFLAAELASAAAADTRQPQSSGLIEEESPHTAPAEGSYRDSFGRFEPIRHSLAT